MILKMWIVNLMGHLCPAAMEGLEEATVEAPFTVGVAMASHQVEMTSWPLHNLNFSPKNSEKNPSLIN